MFLLNTLTANHLEWKTVTGTRMHPEISLLCCSSKMMSLETLFSSFILIFMITSVWEELRRQEFPALARVWRTTAWRVLSQPGIRAHYSKATWPQTLKCSWLLISLTDKPSHPHKLLHAHGLWISDGTECDKEIVPLHYAKQPHPPLQTPLTNLWLMSLIILPAHFCLSLL